MGRTLILIPSLKEGSLIFRKNFIKDSDGVLCYKGAYADIVIVGVGKTLSAINTFKTLTGCDYEKIVLTGICGAYRSSGLSIGEVVTIHEDFFVDEGVFLGDKIIGTDQLGFPIVQNNVVEFDIYEDLKIVNGNTVSLCSGEDIYSSILNSKSGADIETMEGASVGYVLNLFGKKGYHIRAVSNYCGNRKEQEWNIKLAIDNLYGFLFYKFLGGVI